LDGLLRIPLETNAKPTHSSATMVTTKIKQLDAVRAKLAHLEKTVETELRQELAVLHKQYGFADVKSFFKAVRAAVGGGIERARRKVGRPKKAAAALKTRKRAKITAAIRARVKKLVKAGKSGSKIAKAVGISLPSVQNIKKAAGLVKSRKPELVKVPAKKAPVKKKVAKKRAAKKAPAQAAPAPTAVPPPAVATGE
jgi:hypothetical protein